MEEFENRREEMRDQIERIKKGEVKSKAPDNICDSCGTPLDEIELEDNVWTITCKHCDEPDHRYFEGIYDNI